MPDNKNENMADTGITEIGRKSREEAKRSHLKRIILFSLAGMVVFVFLFYAGVYLYNKFGSDIIEGNDDVNYNPTNQTIIFYTPDYSEDIFKDTYYMGLDRGIYYCDPGTGVTVEIIKNEYDNYNDAVKLMYDFINYIIAGDAESYNACFSESYYQDGENQKKEAFTMQKLYNIKITKIAETVSDSTGVSKYVYTLEYMIRQNNGTFRTDVGSDASRTQYITITDTSGKPLIDSINNVVIK